MRYKPKTIKEYGGLQKWTQDKYGAGVYNLFVLAYKQGLNPTNIGRLLGTTEHPIRSSTIRRWIKAYLEEERVRVGV